MSEQCQKNKSAAKLTDRKIFLCAVRDSFRYKLQNAFVNVGTDLTPCILIIQPPEECICLVLLWRLVTSEICCTLMQPSTCHVKMLTSCYCCVPPFSTLRYDTEDLQRVRAELRVITSSCT